MPIYSQRQVVQSGVETRGTPNRKVHIHIDEKSWDDYTHSTSLDKDGLMSDVRPKYTAMKSIGSDISDGTQAWFVWDNEGSDFVKSGAADDRDIYYTGMDAETRAKAKAAQLNTGELRDDLPAPRPAPVMGLVDAIRHVANDLAVANNTQSVSQNTGKGVDKGEPIAYSGVSQGDADSTGDAMRYVAKESAGSRLTQPKWFVMDTKLDCTTPLDNTDEDGYLYVGTDAQQSAERKANELNGVKTMPRYEVRSASSGALGDYIVWDTDTNKVVPRSDGKGVIYYGKDAKKFADTRCYNLNAGINYDGKWKKGGRGRPPKVVEDKNTTPAKATAAPIDQDELEKMLKKLVDEHFETAKQSGILDAHDAINNFLSTAAKRELESKADAISHDFNKKIEAEGQRIAAMIEEVAANKPKVFKVQSDRATTTLSEMTHEKFEALLKTILAGLHPMLVGPAASGKTTAAEQVAKAVGLDFYAMSVGSQSTKSDFLGFYNASGVYVTTMFRKAYEEGGLFLCDEIDAGNANVLVVLNAALSGQFCAFPDGMVERHKDFFFVGTANTYGTGASRQYVGRNQLDAATLDRFTTLNWPIDVRLEAHTVAHLEHGARWHKAVLAARETAERNAYRVVVSPRATMKGAHLFDQGFNVEEVIDMTILATASVDQAPILKSAAMTAWGLD